MAYLGKVEPEDHIRRRTQGGFCLPVIIAFTSPHRKEMLSQKVWQFLWQFSVKD
jgi:hypothetical protein